MDFIPLMDWELAFVPELHYSEWLHHLLAIVSMCLMIEPSFMQKTANILPIIDLYAFGPFLQGFCGFATDLCIFMYHFSSLKPERQFVWMSLSTVLQLLWLLVSNLILPTMTLIKNFGDL